MDECKLSIRDIDEFDGFTEIFEEVEPSTQTMKQKTSKPAYTQTVSVPTGYVSVMTNCCPYIISCTSESYRYIQKQCDKK